MHTMLLLRLPLMLLTLMPDQIIVTYDTDLTQPSCWCLDPLGLREMHA